MLIICSRFALITTLILGAVPVVAGITGTVRVIDGDTLDVGQTRIRLHGIDAPEIDQSCTTLTGQNWACGDWITRQVRDRYQGAVAECDAIDIDRYGRTVARCFLTVRTWAKRWCRTVLPLPTANTRSITISMKKRRSSRTGACTGLSCNRPPAID